jgi:hypothetical protein
MDEVLKMAGGGWSFRLWPNGDYTRYTALFWSFGDDDLIGHGKTPKKAIKNALKGLPA